MNLTLFISIIVFLWPVLHFLYKLFRYCTYVKVKLPCGTFEVKRAFRYDMYVMTRIVSKEFFNGGKVDARNMKALYERYGPLSWDEGRNRVHSALIGLKVWTKRYLTPNKIRLRQMD